jgi:C-terminal four TMM region of protein-O-mannosyltransferase
MISLLKHGNGLSSMLVFECVDGMIRVCLYALHVLTVAVKYYLLGNPINVWSSTASIAVFGVVAFIYLLRWQRHYIDFTPAYLDHIHFAGVYPLLAWGLHYVPFFIMGRYLGFISNPNVVSYTCTTTFQRYTSPSSWRVSFGITSPEIFHQTPNGASLLFFTSL